jgi:hypothetical protein
MAMQTPKQMCGNQRRSLRNIRERVLNMGHEWDQVDMVLMGRLYELVEHIDEALEDFETEATG